MATDRSAVRLSRPVDWDILEALDETGRNVARNLQHHIDANRKYINNRLPYLADYGLVERIGPDPKSGLYEITEKGQIALELANRYDEVDDFDALLEQELEDRADD